MFLGIGVFFRFLRFIRFVYSRGVGGYRGLVGFYWILFFLEFYGVVFTLVVRSFFLSTGFCGRCFVNLGFVDGRLVVFSFRFYE